MTGQGAMGKGDGQSAVEEEEEEAAGGIGSHGGGMRSIAVD